MKNTSNTNDVGPNSVVSRGSDRRYSGFHHISVYLADAVSSLLEASEAHSDSQPSPPTMNRYEGPKPISPTASGPRDPSSTTKGDHLDGH